MMSIELMQTSSAAIQQENIAILMRLLESNPLNKYTLSSTGQGLLVLWLIFGAVAWCSRLCMPLLTFWLWPVIYSCTGLKTLLNLARDCDDEVQPYYFRLVAILGVLPQNFRNFQADLLLGLYDISPAEVQLLYDLARKEQGAMIETNNGCVKNFYF